MVDLQNVCDAFSELHEFIALEPRLLRLLPAAVELRRQASAIAAGERNIPRLQDALRFPEIPDRELAKAIIRIVSKVPNFDGDEDRSLLMAHAKLMANLVDGITLYILKNYPDLMSREPS